MEPTAFVRHSICVYAHARMREVKGMVGIFKALSEESRLRILSLLLEDLDT